MNLCRENLTELCLDNSIPFLQVIVEQDDEDVLLHAAALRRRHHHCHLHHAPRGPLDALRPPGPPPRQLQAGIQAVFVSKNLINSNLIFIRFYGGNIVCKGVKFGQMIGPYLR